MESVQESGIELRVWLWTPQYSRGFTSLAKPLNFLFSGNLSTGMF